MPVMLLKLPKSLTGKCSFGQTHLYYTGSRFERAAPASSQRSSVSSPAFSAASDATVDQSTASRQTERSTDVSTYFTVSVCCIRSRDRSHGCVVLQTGAAAAIQDAVARRDLRLETIQIEDGGAADEPILCTAVERRADQQPIVGQGERDGLLDRASVTARDTDPDKPGFGLIRRIRALPVATRRSWRSPPDSAPLAGAV